MCNSNLTSIFKNVLFPKYLGLWSWFIEVEDDDVEEQLVDHVSNHEDVKEVQGYVQGNVLDDVLSNEELEEVEQSDEADRFKAIFELDDINFELDEEEY